MKTPSLIRRAPTWLLLAVLVGFAALMFPGELRGLKTYVVERLRPHTILSVPQSVE